MMSKIKNLLNRETVLYLLFGVLTTVVNYVVFFLCYNVLLGGKGSIYANILAFIVAVLFAFFVNKRYVFESKSWSLAVLKKEVPSFFAARIGSFFIEEAGLFVAEKLLKWNELQLVKINTLVIDGVTAVKILLAFVVVLLNYVFCKLFIFKDTEDK